MVHWREEKQKSFVAHSPLTQTVKSLSVPQYSYMRHLSCLNTCWWGTCSCLSTRRWGTSPCLSTHRWGTSPCLSTHRWGTSPCLSTRWWGSGTRRPASAGRGSCSWGWRGNRGRAAARARKSRRISWLWRGGKVSVTLNRSAYWNYSRTSLNLTSQCFEYHFI